MPPTISNSYIHLFFLISRPVIIQTSPTTPIILKIIASIIRIMQGVYNCFRWGEIRITLLDNLFLCESKALTERFQSLSCKWDLQSHICKGRDSNSRKPKPMGPKPIPVDHCGTPAYFLVPRK